jgi:hypothetical protein
VFETEGVSPVYCGATAREYALSCARQRAGYAPTEVCVLDNHWNVAERIAPENTRWLICNLPVAERQRSDLVSK